MMNVSVPDLPARPAWVEIDIAQLERNFAIINADRPDHVRVMSVVKDDAYGHGAVEVARTALAAGVEGFATVTLAEAIQLRDAGFEQKIIMLGERADAEIPFCVERDLTTCINSAELVKRISEAAQAQGKRASVHLKINTGMNRYGVHWTQAAIVAELIHRDANLKLDGVLSHFAMSDESDKSFAQSQMANFREALAQIQAREIAPGIRHMCNSGGFLDLPDAHFDMVRVGILSYGVYPSKVCRRLPGIAPVMSVKTRISGFQNLQQGDKVGYGMRYTAEGPRRIAVLPIGYGDGFPRVRNTGCVLIGGRRAPIVGGVAMDSFTVDATEIPEAKLWDEVVIMGRQGAEELTAHDVAALTGTVSYAVLTSWRSRLPRVYVNRGTGVGGEK
jgi:alanine racemase